MVTSNHLPAFALVLLQVISHRTDKGAFETFQWLLATTKKNSEVQTKAEMAPHDLAPAYLSNRSSYSSSASTLCLRLALLLFFKYSTRGLTSWPLYAPRPLHLNVLFSHIVSWFTLCLFQSLLKCLLFNLFFFLTFNTTWHFMANVLFLICLTE